MRNYLSMKKSIVLLFLLCVFSIGAYAQSVVNGIVNDESGEPIIGAAVRVAGTTVGTVTDVNGHFQLNVKPDAQLTVSYIGYKEMTVDVAGQTNIKVALPVEDTELSDVVVIGYGTSKRSDISGSVASVDANAMLKKAPVNLSDGLKGSAPGVLVTSQDGAPDALAQVRIRGVGTINGSADPLYVVDGVQVGTNANFLNPQDIASIEVLKDASATAIYGSRGANGVVMITTKHGSKGSLHIDVSGNWSIQTVQHHYDVLDNVDDYAKLIRTARAADGTNISQQIWDSQYDGKRNYIDWQDEMTRAALRQSYQMSASGGTDKLQANFSVGYLDNDGLVVNTNYRRMNLRASLNAKANNYLSAGGDVAFTHGVSKGSNAGYSNDVNLSSTRDYAILMPTMDYISANNTIVHPNVVNSDGTYGTFYQTTQTGTEINGTDNYYAQQMELDAPTRSNRLLANAFVDLTFIKGLSLKSIISFDYSNSDTYSWEKVKKRYNEIDGVNTEIAPVNMPTTAEFNLSQSVSYSKAIETYLTYHLEKNKHDFTIMLGNSVSKSDGRWVSAGAKDFPAESIRDLGLTQDTSTRDGDGAFSAETRFISYFGRAMYSYGGRYNLTATIRRDGSSNFGAGNRWGTFPSVAASWRISEEAFMKDQDVVHNLKLRLGWGQTGNAGSATSLAVNQLSTDGNMYHFYSAGSATYNPTVGNGMAAANLIDTNLKWETNEQWNVGLDFALLGGDLNVALDYFVRTSKDLLLYQGLRPSTGYDQIYTNYGEIQNKGFEFALNYNKRINSDWTFGVTLTGSTLKNEIVKSGVDIFNTCSSGNDGTNIDGSNVQGVGAEQYYWNNHSICREGYAVGSFYGYKTNGLIRSQSELDRLNAEAVAKGWDSYQGTSTTLGDILYQDVNGDGHVSEDDMTIIGDGFPTLNFGLNLTASFRNWDFAIYTYGVLGQDILSYSAMRLETVRTGDSGTTVSNILKSAYDDVYSAENPNGSKPRLTILDSNHNTRCSDWWVKNGNFWKINNVQVGYNLPKSVLTPLKITSARVNFSVSNLLTISPYNKYGDPECGQGYLVYTGLDTGRYPTARSFALGLNIQF